MTESCKNCRFSFPIAHWDYTKVGKEEEWKKDLDGMACILFTTLRDEEPFVIWATGSDYGICECWEERKYTEPSKSTDQNVADVPSGDLISRETLIGAIEKCGEDKIYPQALIETIKALPSAVCDDCIWRVCNYNSVDWEKTSADRPITKDTQCQEKNDHSGEVTEMVDLISREDAIEVVRSAISEEWLLREAIVTDMEALPSADAEPTVIRSRTLLPTKDFKEWAKRVRETNPNAVVIPCDAEVVSADRPQVDYDSAEEQIAETEQKLNRPKGEWRWTHGGQCSECGFHNSNFDFNFCPSCGADMRGDK